MTATTNPVDGLATEVLVRVGTAPMPVRQCVVEFLIQALVDEQTDERSALFLLDLAGLTGDRDALADALTATATITALMDGATTARDVDPGLTLPGEQARDYLLGSLQDQLDEAVQRLAAQRPPALTAVPS